MDLTIKPPLLLLIMFKKLQEFNKKLLKLFNNLLYNNPRFMFNNNNKVNKQFQEVLDLNTTLTKLNTLNTIKLKELLKKKLPFPLKELFLNLELSLKWSLKLPMLPIITPLNIKNNTFPEPFTTPLKNKFPSPELNTFPFKELNMLLKKELTTLNNLDKLPELNMMKLNIKFKDLKFTILKFNKPLFNTLKFNTFNKLPFNILKFNTYKLLFNILKFNILKLLFNILKSLFNKVTTITIITNNNTNNNKKLVNKEFYPNKI